MQPNEARWWSHWWGAEDESFVCFTINLHLESDQVETMSNNGCILLKKPRRRLFLNFLKTRLSSNNFFSLTQKPRVAPFSRNKKGHNRIYRHPHQNLGASSGARSHQLDASEGPIIHYQLSNSDEKAFNAAQKMLLKCSSIDILENSSPFYSSLFSSQLPHPHE